MTKNEKIDNAIKYLESFSPIHGNSQAFQDVVSSLESLKTKPKKEAVEKVFGEEVDNCYNKCLTSFPYYLHPNNSDTWKDTIEKLNRIDGVPFESIIEITAWARADYFWMKNFMSLVKLRQKSKQDLKWIVEFNEKMKNEKNKSVSAKGASVKELKDALTKHFD